MRRNRRVGGGFVEFEAGTSTRSAVSDYERPTVRSVTFVSGRSQSLIRGSCFFVYDIADSGRVGLYGAADRRVICSPLGAYTETIR